MDFVNGILGVQTLEKAQIITWSSGEKMVLSYAMGRYKGHKVNMDLLKADVKYVKQLAALPEATSSSKYLVFLEKDMVYSQLLVAAHEAMSLNKSVVVWSFL
jgi:hypothetical protein